LLTLVPTINYFRFAALYYNFTLAQLLWSTASYVVLALFFTFVVNVFFKLKKQKRLAG